MSASITRRWAAGVVAGATVLVVGALPAAALTDAPGAPERPDLPAIVDRTDHRTDFDGDYSPGGRHVERSCFMVRSAWGEGGDHVPRCYTYVRNRPAEQR